MENSKILDLGKISKVARELKDKGKKIVLAHGSFDLIDHADIHYLRESKKLGDILIVSVIENRFVRKGLEKPAVDENIRFSHIASFGFVDYVVPCGDFGPWGVIEKIKPDIYTKSDYDEPQLEDKDSGVSRDKKLVEFAGGEIRFIRSMARSKDLLSDHFNSFSKKTLDYVRGFKRRHNVADVLIAIERLSELRVLVIGETIIDEYCHMRPLGRPSKSHVVCAQYVENERFAGGAVALANNVASVCKQVDLLTYLGDEKDVEFFVRKALRTGVEPIFFRCDQPTILKRRFMNLDDGAKLFEEYRFSQKFLPQDQEEAIFEFLSGKTKKYDLVIVADYGHGFLSKKLIKIIISGSKILSANAQTNSGNIGFNYITKYLGADFVCVDEMEARLAVRDNTGDIKDVFFKLYKKIHAEKMIVTLGRDGCLAYDGKSFLEMPTMSGAIVDAVGAGDAFLAFASPCLAAGFSMELAAFIGSVASSVAVKIMGHRKSVEKDDLCRIIGFF